jgi:ABC-type uncharacterized transport system ATPase subunit
VLPVGARPKKKNRSAAREGGPVRIGAYAAPSVRLFGIREAMMAVNGLIYSYSNRKPPAIDTLDFEIRCGEIFGFLGPSGAGKSTTQKILLGLLTGYSGSVLVLGKAPGNWGAGYYERIGVSFEMPNHFLKWTALQNLRYFAALYARPGLEPQALLEKVGLQAGGGKPVAQFSKGMKSRLNVARPLINNPELLFLDEPTSGLDPVNARLVKNLIREQQQSGKTVFLTTQTMTVAEGLCRPSGRPVFAGRCRQEIRPARGSSSPVGRTSRCSWRFSSSASGGCPRKVCNADPRPSTIEFDHGRRIMGHGRADGCWRSLAY